LAGNSGLPAAFRSSYDIKHVAKKVTSQSPLKSRLKLRLNGLFWRNNPVKQYFPEAWTPTHWSQKKGSSDWLTGHFTGLSEIRSCLHLHYTYRNPPDAEPGQTGRRIPV
jgi:hypothetical protein